MALTREEVLHVAHLARLSLKPEEIELFTRQLNDILAYVEKLQELDTDGVPPMAHVLPVFNAFREDEVAAGLAPGHRPWTTPRPGKRGPSWCPGSFKDGFWFGVIRLKMKSVLR